MQSHIRTRSGSGPKTLEAKPNKSINFRNLMKSAGKVENKEFRLGKQTKEDNTNENTNAYTRNRYSLEKDNNPKKLDDGILQNQYLKRTQASLKSIKISRFRSLLPNYLNTKFPQKLARLCTITNKMDQYFQNLSKKSKNKNYSQSFINLKQYLHKIESMNVEEFQLKQINFIVPGFYAFYEDPLKNLIVQYPKCQSIHIRQQQFRKMVYKYYTKSNMEDSDCVLVPTLEFVRKRTQYFYERKKFKAEQKEQKIRKSIIKQQFIDSILNEVKRKEELHKDYQSGIDKIKVTKQDISTMKKCIEEVYQENKVKNMFKANLIELMDSKMGSGIEFVLKGLQLILSNNENLKQVVINQRPIINYQFPNA